jgi:two-component system nitrogen regulation response regulator NtrX
MSLVHLRQRVLVVDDEEPIRNVVSDVLTDEGYDVSVAVDGSDALRSCRRNDPDLILLDLNMPGVDGRTFLAAYRREPGEHAPVVIFSAVQSARRVADEIHADGFLSKPFVIADLADIVRRHLAPVA